MQEKLKAQEDVKITDLQEEVQEEVQE